VQRDEPVPFEEIASVWQRLTGQDISHGTGVWASVFTDAARLVTEYRRGRVLLAGDAAHIHLPAGGQGMNTGIQDAVNLGWKLGAVVHGWAPHGLLDSYHNERYPVGKRLLMNTRAQGLLFLGGLEIEPLREVIGELLVHEDVRRTLAGMVSGLEIRYDVGIDGHPLLGRRVPHQELITQEGKTSTTEALNRANGVLFDFADDAGLRRIASGWSGRVDVVTAAPHEPPPGSSLSGVDALLVRPDGHIVWTDVDGDVARALFRWFGAAR
jgi:bifunctional hydroxylase/dehydrase